MNMNSSKYREKIYRKYVETLTRYSEQPNDEQEYERRKKLYDLNYKQFLPSDKDSTILELGCGKGFFLKYLEEMGYSHIRGVEKSESQILHALSDVKDYIIVDDMFNYLKNCAQKFDLIVLFHVLEHLFKDEILDILELIYDSLTDKGTLIIEVPNAGSPIFGGNSRFSEFTHEVGFTPPSLKEVILVSGFEKVKVYPIRGLSIKARVVFNIVNFFIHSRFTKDIFVEGEIFAVVWKR